MSEHTFGTGAQLLCLELPRSGFINLDSILGKIMNVPVFYYEINTAFWTLLVMFKG